MTDYSSLANISRPLPYLANSQAAASSATSTQASTAGADSGQFQQMLTTLLLGLSLQNMMGSSDASMGSLSGMNSLSGLNSGLNGGLMSGLGQSSSSSSNSWGSVNSLIAPVMIQLLEKMLAQDVRSDQNTVQATTIQPTTTDAASSEPTGRNKPQGMPVKGVLTQSSHSGHIALDIGVSVGTKVKSTMDGKVVYAGWNNEGYGNLVIVENGGYRTYYAHLSEIPVEVGQTVAAGTVIGLSGNTGNSTGPHLHYEVRKNGQQLDPADFV